MPTLIESATVVQAAGTLPKRIEEYVGRVNTGHDGVSVARMVSPAGWEKPGQRPEFEEITVVLRGLLRVEHEAGTLDVQAGQAVVTNRASGSATAVRNRAAPSTWRSVYRRLHPPPCTGTRFSWRGVRLDGVAPRSQPGRAPRAAPRGRGVDGVAPRLRAPRTRSGAFGVPA